MNREEFLFELNTIVRQLTCMSDTTFNERCDGSDVHTFCRFKFGTSEKVLTTISMKVNGIESDG